MSTLLVEQLKNKLTQNFNLSLSVRYNIGGFYPYLYMHNAPAGTFIFEILNGEDSLFSKEFTSNDIKSALDTADDFARVFYPILPENPFFLEKGDYTAKLSATGYSPTGESFLGWIKEHEDAVNALSYSPNHDGQKPLAMKMKVYKQGTEL